MSYVLDFPLSGANLDYSLGAELGIIDAQGGATAVDDVFGLGGALADGNADFMEATGGMAGMIFSGATRAGRPRAEGRALSYM